MDSNNKTARTAGFLYLIVVITGIFSLVYVPSQITGKGDAPAMVNSIVASESLFRLGIASFMINQSVFLLLPLVLYKLLQQVDRSIAVVMVVFAVVSVPIAMISIANKLEVLDLLHGARYLQADQLQNEVMLSLNAYSSGIRATTIFWGLWLLPFGYLVIKSGFLPRILGILLIIGCFGILAGLFGSTLFPGYAETAISTFFEMSSSFGEIGICLWLLIFGVRKPAALGTT